MILVKGVTLLEKRENIKKLRSLAKKVLLVGVLTITAFGLTELAFEKIEQIEEERCWHVVEDSAQAMNKEIRIRFEDNINMLRIASRLMVQADIIHSYKEVVEHINSFYDKTIFKNIEVLYPDNTLVFQTGETVNVSDVTLFDVYEGVQLPPNKKSMAYSVVFTPKDEELKAKKVEGFVKDILAHLKETAGITLRG